MRRKAREIVVGVVLLSPGTDGERTQPTRGSATYSHFTEPRGGAQNTARRRSSAERSGADFLSDNLTLSFFSVEVEYSTCTLYSVLTTHSLMSPTCLREKFK